MAVAVAVVVAVVALLAVAVAVVAFAVAEAVVMLIVKFSSILTPLQENLSSLFFVVVVVHIRRQVDCCI